MPRLRRFLHLERPRAGAAAEGGEPEPAPATAGRFEGVTRPTGANAPAAPSSSGAELGRFGPEPEPGLELVHAEPGARPFTRCMRCGRDHDLFATVCAGCEASLDTPAQREFNERLWARLQEEAAREAAAEAERKAVAARAGEDLAASRRAMGEALAREVGRRERARLAGDGSAWGLPREARVGRALRWLLRLLGG